MIVVIDTPLMIPGMLAASLPGAFRTPPEVCSRHRFESAASLRKVSWTLANEAFVPRSARSCLLHLLNATACDRSQRI